MPVDPLVRSKDGEAEALTCFGPTVAMGCSAPINVMVA